MTDEPVLAIRDGRHPVLDAIWPPGTFVPNDVELGARRAGRSLLITGPNMAGKSHLHPPGRADHAAGADRQLRARRERARIGVVDRIFTRVGASDELARGRIDVHGRDDRDRQHPATTPRRAAWSSSTRSAAARAPSTACRSPGRSPSTCTTQSAAATLFATHYHELTELAEHLPARAQLQRRRARVGGRGRLPAPHRRRAAPTEATASTSPGWPACPAR